MSATLSILPDRCIACGLCERLAPDLFAVIDHDVAVALAAEVSGPDLDRAEDAACACPTEAIDVTL